MESEIRESKAEIYADHVNKLIDKIWDTYDYNGEDTLDQNDAKEFFKDLL